MGKNADSQCPTDGYGTDKTIIRFDEKKLLKSKAFLRNILENMMDGVTIANTQGDTIYMNRAALSQFGYTKEEYIGKASGGLFADEKELLKYFKELTVLPPGGYLEPRDYMAKRKDGTRFPVSVNVSVINDDNGNPEAFVAVHRDISERKRVEENLAKSEERFALAMKGANDGLWDWNVETNELYLSPRWKQMLGYGDNELEISYDAWKGMVHPDDIETVKKHIKAYLNGETDTYEIEYRMRHRDGHFINILSRGFAVKRESDGTFIRLVGTNIDITRRRKAEAALRESEEKYRILVENANDAILVLQDGMVKFHNRKTEALSGYAPEELKARPFVEFIHPDDRSEALDLHDRRLRREQVEATSIRRIIGRDGKEIWGEISAVLIEWEGKPAVLCFIKDITQEKKLEERLFHAQKMEAIGTLAGGIAHDFNNLLYPIVGYTEIMLEGVPEGSRVYKDMTQVVNAAMRAKDLINQILLVSRQTMNELVPLKIQLVLKEALTLIGSTFPSSIKIRQNISSDCGYVMADPTQIHQVAMNLFTNALHAMGYSAGTLSVFLEEKTIDGSEEADRHLTPGSYACLTVSDTGPGIEKEIIKRIFEPYFTTKEKGKGTGLGLSVVHGIVKTCGGEIRVESTPGKGATFIIYLPIIDYQEDKVVYKNAGPLPRGREHILLVDDNDTIVILEKDVFESLGYTVTTATDPVEALKMFVNAPDTYDVVITDQTMPNMTGDHLAKEILAIRKDTPVILCTGYSEIMDDRKAKEIGIREFMIKPVGLRDFAETIRNVLVESSGVSYSKHDEILIV